MAGLSRICKQFGSITTRDQSGNSFTWVWDYVADKAVPETDMPFGSDRWKASERKKYGVK
jgi:hypothetical protein